jgi:hypothetical protein
MALKESFLEEAEKKKKFLNKSSLISFKLTTQLYRGTLNKTKLNIYDKI